MKKLTGWTDYDERQLQSVLRSMQQQAIGGQITLVIAPSVVDLIGRHPESSHLSTHEIVIPGVIRIALVTKSFGLYQVTGLNSPQNTDG